jgi:HD-GYP domain-containing protein (c-di-GMP phosphodiesterase class II)
LRPFLFTGIVSLLGPARFGHTRSQSDRRLPSQAWLFWGLIVGTATALCAILEWRQPLDRQQWSQVLLWLLIGLVAHAGEFEIKLPDNSKIFLSAGFAVSSIAVAELPLVGAMIAVAIGSITINQITKSSRPLATVLFNRGALALCAAAGSVAFSRMATVLPHLAMLPLVGSTLVASIVYGSLSLSILSTAMALRAGYSLRRPWQWPLGGSPSVYVNYLVLGMLGDLILSMYHTGGAIGLMLSLLPLGVTYYSLRQSASMRRLYDAVVSTLVDSLDLRDHDTGGHTRRVAALAVRLGRRLGVEGQAMEDLRIASLLHDLGKIGVPDSILLKSSGLTVAEWEAMRVHPQLGADLLRSHGLLEGAIPLIHHHQERFDGSGYPDQLCGERIPLGSRIIAVADAFMAMVDGRPYRKARSIVDAYAELRRCAGSQFDPKVVAALQPTDWETVLQDTPPALVGHFSRA